jgi:hypothetical protein
VTRLSKKGRECSATNRDLVKASIALALEQGPLGELPPVDAAPPTALPQRKTPTNINANVQENMFVLGYAESLIASNNDTGILSDDELMKLLSNLLKEQLGYRKLQNNLKERGLKASGTASALATRLEQHIFKKLASDDLE